MSDVIVVTHRPISERGLIIVDEDGSVSRLPVSPKSWKYSDNHRWGTVEREGLKHIARRRGSGVRTLDFSILVAAMDYHVSVESKIAQVTGWAARGNVFRIKNGSVTYQGSCWWYVKDMDLDVQRLTPDGLPTQALITISLEEYAGAVTAVIKPPPPPPPPPPPIPTPTPKPAPVVAPVYRYHTTVWGDTLYKISYRYLGTCYRWREIYELNKVIIGPWPNHLHTRLNLKIPPK